MSEGVLRNLLADRRGAANAVVLRMLVVGVAIFGLAFISLQLPRAPGHFVPICVTNGTLLFALFFTRWRLWPSVAVAAFIGMVGAAAAAGSRIDLSAALALCSLVQCMVCAVAVNRVIGGAPSLASL